MEMGIIMLVSTSMACLKASASIVGLMEVTIREISSRAIGAAMVSGRPNKEDWRTIVATTMQIERLVMESILGTMGGSIRGTSIMTIVMAMASSMIQRAACSIRASGTMESSQIARAS